MDHRSGDVPLGGDRPLWQRVGRRLPEWNMLVAVA